MWNLWKNKVLEKPYNFLTWGIMADYYEENGFAVPLARVFEKCYHEKFKNHLYGKNEVVIKDEKGRTLFFLTKQHKKPIIKDYVRNYKKPEFVTPLFEQKDKAIASCMWDRFEQSVSTYKLNGGVYSPTKLKKVIMTFKQNLDYVHLMGSSILDRPIFKNEEQICSVGNIRNGIFDVDYSGVFPELVRV